MGGMERAYEASQEHLIAGANHPCAAMPLTAFQSVTAVCGDCGHSSVLDRDRLIAMAAVSDFATLWRHAYCAECRAEGSSRRNVVLHPLQLEATRLPDPQWSHAQVFGDDRSDLTPGLSRRQLFTEA